MTKKTLALCLALAACTTPADVSKPIAAGKGNDAKVQIIDTPEGFNVDVKYSRYQMIPETSAVLTVCRSTVIARVAEEAKNRGREIEPIEEQNVRLSSGRNSILGLTACRAFAEAKFRQ